MYGRDVLQLRQQLVVEAAAYSAGDWAGNCPLAFNINQFRDFGGCILDQVLITDQARQSIDWDLLLFEAAPTTTMTENGAADLADADQALLLGAVSVTTDVLGADNGFAYARGIGLPISLHNPPAGWTLYGALILRTGPTFAATTDVAIRLGFRRV